MEADTDIVARAHAARTVADLARLRRELRRREARQRRGPERAHANGRYVSANHPLGALRADATGIGFWEEFALRFNTDGSVSLLNPFGEPIGPMNLANTLIHAYAPGSGPSYGPEFEIVPLQGWVKLRAKSNNNFVVVSDELNAQPVGAWEEFLLMWNPDGTFSLKAPVKGYVAAHPDGITPLIADRPAIDVWEKFDLVDQYGMIWRRAPGPPPVAADLTGAAGIGPSPARRRCPPRAAVTAGRAG